MNILFVCTGNISRSFLAEKLLKNEVATLKLMNICTLSVGLFAYPGSQPDPIMVDYLSKRGIPEERHEAKQITKEHVEWSDLILVMEKGHARMIEESWPEVKGKVELLGQLASEGQHKDDVIDPFGKSPYHYRLAQAQITMAIHSLVKRLISDQDKDPNAQN